MSNVQVGKRFALLIVLKYNWQNTLLGNWILGLDIDFFKKGPFI